MTGDRPPRQLRLFTGEALAPIRALHSDRFLIEEWALPAGTSVPRHVHERFSLVLQLRGGFTQAIQSQTLEMAAGAALTVPAGEAHSEQVASEGSNALIVTWLAQGNPTVPVSLKQSPVYVDTGDAGRLSRLILNEIRHPDDLTELATEAHVLGLTALLARQPAQDSTGSQPAWLARVRERLEDNFFSTPQLDELARIGGVSRGHLTRVFRATYGTSVGQFVRRLRVDHAARLLRNHALSLSQVALAAGFYDQSHLTRLFKETFGVTPLQYRTSWDCS